MKRNPIRAIYDIYIWKISYNHYYTILNSKCSAEKTTAQWMDICVKSNQRVKKIVQNNQRTLNRTPHRKQIWYIFYSPVHCLWTVTCHIVFFKSIIFNNCIKQLEMKLQPFPAIVTNVSEFFVWFCRQAMNAIHIIFSWLHVFGYFKNIGSFHHTYCSLNALKCTNNNSIHRPYNVFEFFCWPLYTDNNSAFHKKTSSSIYTWYK